MLVRIQQDAERKKTMEYLGHLNEEGQKQALLDHLQGTAKLAREFAKPFGAENLGYFVGLIHDLGKYSKEFQNRLCQGGPIVDHSTAGALECAKIGQVSAAFCVAGHHSGLPDMGTEDDRTSLKGRLAQAQKKGKSQGIPDYSAWKGEVSLTIPDLPLWLQKESSMLTNVFFTRMLFSCLVDADFLDTEQFMSRGCIKRNPGDKIGFLKEKLDTYLQNWYPPKGELNTKRCEILGNCIDKSGEREGLFTLTVPTGGGKTVASLAFALHHAEQKQLRRVIYVIPYTSIIEQNAEVFKKILGDQNVLEHHSGFIETDDERETPQVVERRLATENWDKPVIVTTAVQFFESLFSDRSSQSRKLHNIAESVIIFDEAQMMPLPYLKPCIYAIAELIQHYRVSAVLCTATQPSLEHFFRLQMGEYQPLELCPKELAESSIFKRTSICVEGVIPWNELAERMNTEKQILCIVNSRKNAKEVFEELEEEGRYHLSTLMIAADRKEKLKEIRKRLSEGKICRVVSTSLIEAGVDIDFPMVMREMAGLDSILQAAGRCNREGKRSPAESIVTIFLPETKPPSIFSPNIAAGQFVLEHYDAPFSEEAIDAYFSELYDIRGESYFDGKEIIKKLDRDLAFRTVGRNFHLIETEMTALYVPVGEGEKLVERRLSGEISKDLLRQLGTYSVNVFSKHLAALQQAGDITAIGDDEWYLCNMELYRRATGLSLDADYGKANFI